MMLALKRIAKAFAHRVVLLFPHPPNPIHLWKEQRDFQELYAQVKASTLVDEPRCFMLYQLSRSVAALTGAVAEVGVYRGGTARLLGRLLGESGKTVHLFDTFAGMPKTDPVKDKHPEGVFQDTSLESVRRYLGDCKHMAFHPGWFPETAKGLEAERFCFVHVDADIYESVKACCDYFYPRLVPGGLMVFDDYGFLDCPGARQAVNEFAEKTQTTGWYLPTGQYVVRAQ